MDILGVGLIPALVSLALAPALGLWLYLGILSDLPSSLSPFSCHLSSPAWVPCVVLAIETRRDPGRKSLLGELLQCCGF